MFYLGFQLFNNRNTPFKLIIHWHVDCRGTFTDSGPRSQFNHVILDIKTLIIDHVNHKKAYKMFCFLKNEHVTSYLVVGLCNRNLLAEANYEIMRPWCPQRASTCRFTRASRICGMYKFFSNTSDIVPSTTYLPLSWGCYFIIKL